MPDIFTLVDRYVDGLFAPEDEALAAVHETARAAGMPNIAVAPNQGKLLNLFAKLIGARRILEFGTLAGYSAIWMARALPEDGKLISLEYDPAYAETDTDIHLRREPGTGNVAAGHLRIGGIILKRKHLHSR